jgi:hypothetical protein
VDQTHPDPIGEAIAGSSRRATQTASLFIALTQAWATHQARHQHQQAARDQHAATTSARAQGALSGKPPCDGASTRPPTSYCKPR